MLNGIVAAAFKDIIKSDKVRFDIYVGVIDRIAYPRLRREIHDNIGVIFFKKLGKGFFVGNIAVAEDPFTFGIAV